MKTPVRCASCGKQRGFFAGITEPLCEACKLDETRDNTERRHITSTAKLVRQSRGKPRPVLKCKKRRRMAAKTGPKASYDIDEILAFIKSYIVANGFPPTVREIMEANQMSSTSVASYYLKLLEKDGRITRQHHRARSIVVLDLK